jgi:hypothetical protein
MNIYTEKLNALPAPGCGRHMWLLSVSNSGIKSGISPYEIYSDIRRTITDGRHIPDREVWSAIKKAHTDHTGGTYTPRLRPKPVVRDGKTALERIISQAQTGEEVDIWESSPIRILDEPKDHTPLFLSAMFEPFDLLFIGKEFDLGRLGTTIRTTDEWVEYFKSGGKPAPFIIVNPLTGEEAPTKDEPDKMTLRGDNNIAAFRYCLVEFDKISLESQYRFWAAAKLPVQALVFTGGKSIHAWLKVSHLAKVETSEQWDTNIRQRLYGSLLAPLGVDKACSNPSRLSRLPGHYRAEKQAYQRLIWLASEGK